MLTSLGKICYHFKRLLSVNVSQYFCKRKKIVFKEIIKTYDYLSKCIRTSDERLNTVQSLIPRDITSCLFKHLDNSTVHTVQDDDPSVVHNVEECFQENPENEVNKS